MLGCHGGGASLHYADRPEQSDTCPRRWLRRHPDLGAAFELWRLHGGVPSAGLAALETFTGDALDALWVIDSALSYRREREQEQAAAEAAARASS
jgi:hypothetical protein